MKQMGVYFIYDGGCPLCSYMAQASRIKRTYGTLHLINAREDTDHPLLQEIKSRDLNLDDGMVIYHAPQFYHGKDALTFMAKHGEASSASILFCKIFFWSETLSAFIYPCMRGVRNWLLKRLGRPQLNNLGAAESQGKAHNTVQHEHSIDPQNTIKDKAVPKR